MIVTHGQPQKQEVSTVMYDVDYTQEISDNITDHYDGYKNDDITDMYTQTTTPTMLTSKVSPKFNKPSNIPEKKYQVKQRYLTYTIVTPSHNTDDNVTYVTQTMYENSQTSRATIKSMIDTIVDAVLKTSKNDVVQTQTLRLELTHETTDANGLQVNNTHTTSQDVESTTVRDTVTTMGYHVDINDGLQTVHIPRDDSTDNEIVNSVYITNDRLSEGWNKSVYTDISTSPYSAQSSEVLHNGSTFLDIFKTKYVSLYFLITNVINLLT